jgi:tRNA(fMet)-specific endonuclease VapC
MPLYLLDTNIVSDLLKNPHGRVAIKIAEVGEDAIATSIVVAAEVRFGAAKWGSPGLTARVEAILGAITILPLQPPADTHYGKIRATLEQSGRMIGANDLLIAAHALSISRILVTGNVGEFQRVDGLRVENWLET